jgi:hydroxymethylglutaryl-CoA reductase
MSRAPVFFFNTPDEAIVFAERIPSLFPQFAKDAEKTSRFARLQHLTPHVIGANVHVKFDFFCGDATGQNMVTIATQSACDAFLSSPLAHSLGVCDFVIDGDMASDKKGSSGNVHSPRGVQVLAYGELSNDVCESVLKISTERLYKIYMVISDGRTRNLQFGSNINTANVVAAIFIACGQDAGSVAESAWSQLSMDFDWETKNLKVSLFFPSLPVGTVGGGTAYPSQKASLELLDCTGVGSKWRLAGLVACFAMALDISTLAAVASGGFTDSHKRLARGKSEKSRL